MGFRGSFDAQGIVGAETRLLSATGTATGPSNVPEALPAGATRWRIFAAWITVGGVMEAAAADPSAIKVDTILGINSAPFTTFGALNVSMAAAPGEFAHESQAVEVIRADRGLVLPDGEDLYLFFSVNKLGTFAATDPATIFAWAEATVYCRAET